jgi:hypothetical protein
MEFKEFMEWVWDQKTVNGQTVLDKRVCYGAEPDIQFTVQTENGDIEFVSAKKMFWNQMAEIAEMQGAADNGVALW